MKKIFARFKSKCADSGKRINKGDEMYYNYSTKKCYSLDSETAIKFEIKEAQEQEWKDTASYIDAQEQAYCNNLYGY